MLAHDLRNLLWPIEARLFALRRGPSARAGRRTPRTPRRASKTLRRLAGLIANMLDSARIDEGIFQLDAGPFRWWTLSQDVAAG